MAYLSTLLTTLIDVDAIEDTKLRETLYNIIVDGTLVPMEVSIFGFIIAFLLALWMFAASRK